MLVRAATVVTPDHVVERGAVRTDRRLVVDVGPASELVPHPGEEVADFPGCTITPGLVDMHCHGGASASFSGRDAADVVAAVRFHRSRGTTTVVASLVSAPADELASSVCMLADLAEEGLIAGTHLEGPFLSHTRCGAQNPAALVPADTETMGRLLELGRGTVRMVTIAPELTGALDVVRQVRDAGALPAVGHTDATFQQTIAAIDAGARVMTHLFNGMRPVHHREPGPVVAALERPEVCCELIADDNHLHPAIVHQVMSAAGPGRVALMSDAIAAAGMDDGDYELGGLAVVVRGGVARLAEGGSLAGSTITVSDAVRSVLSRSPAGLRETVLAATATPAALVAPNAGTLAPGRPADLVVWDAGMHPVKVMAGGRWAPAEGEEGGR
jgi:N-acetylglucosamine-6-phosphate deacetylase